MLSTMGPFLPFCTAKLSTSYKILDKGLYEILGPEGAFISVTNVVKNMLAIETNLLVYRSLLFLLFFAVLIVSVILSKALFVLFLFVIFHATDSSKQNILEKS